MNVFRHALLLATSLLSLTGCQVCFPSLKKACLPEESASEEIHVRAPPRKVIVHRDRDDCASPETPCEGRPTPAEAKGGPSPAETKGNPSPRQPAPMMPMGQPVAQTYAAPPAAASGFAAIPTLPTCTALTLTFDVIRIPIPIPRLRTVDVPPETRLSFVQLGATSSLGAVAAAPAPIMAAPVAPAAYVQQAAEPQSECIRPEQIAAAAALVRTRAASQSNSASQASAASSTGASDEERIERANRELEKANQAIDRLERALDSKLKAESQGEEDWKRAGTRR